MTKTKFKEFKVESTVDSFFFSTGNDTFYVTQDTYPAINTIAFREWKHKDDQSSDEFTTAIWKVSRVKPTVKFDKFQGIQFVLDKNTQFNLS